MAVLRSPACSGAKPVEPFCGLPCPDEASAIQRFCEHSPGLRPTPVRVFAGQAHGALVVDPRLASRAGVAWIAGLIHHQKNSAAWRLTQSCLYPDSMQSDIRCRAHREKPVGSGLARGLRLEPPRLRACRFRSVVVGASRKNPSAAGSGCLSRTSTPLPAVALSTVCGQAVEIAGSLFGPTARRCGGHRRGRASGSVLAVEKTTGTTAASSIVSLRQSGGP